MSTNRATIITCDMCGKEIIIKDNGISRPRIPDGWKAEGINSFDRRREIGDATCPECTPIVEAAQAKYDNAVADAEREYIETLKKCKKAKPQATAKEENHHEQDF